jgi:hypothetical protein
MKKIMKKVMGKPMKKAQKGKQVPMYDDDMNDRIMADTYADYMNDKKRGKIPLEPTIQKGIKDGTLNPDGTIKTGKKRGSESNTSRTPMKKGGVIKKKMKMGGVVKKAQLGMKSVKAGYDNNKGVTRADFVSIGKGEAKKGTKMKKAQMGTDMMQSPMMKKGGAMKKCKYGCK